MKRSRDKRESEPTSMADRVSRPRNQLSSNQDGQEALVALEQQTSTSHPTTAVTRREITVTFVTNSGCHYCHEAALLLEDLAPRFPILVEEVLLTSPRGGDIAVKFRIPFPPVILLDGDYHAHGRISERKLTKALTRLVEAQ